MSRLSTPAPQIPALAPAALVVDGLRVSIGPASNGRFPVDGVSFEVADGSGLGVVGESGSGKSLTLRAVLGLLPPGVARVAGVMRLAGEEYAPHRVRGHGMAMVFQEPSAALNPLMTVGRLLGEALRVRGLRGGEAREGSVALLDEVGVPDPARRLRTFPHELSGGLRQRVMIAMALASEPRVLLCDEPTTALDATVQAQILELLNRLKVERSLSLVFVTHDLAVLDGIVEDTAVMYAGRIIERGATRDVLREPQHPYTAALLASLPHLDNSDRRLAAIPGAPPEPGAFPEGCRFHPRCAHAQEKCRSAPYELEEVEPGRSSACIRSREVAFRERLPQ